MRSRGSRLCATAAAALAIGVAGCGGEDDADPAAAGGPTGVAGETGPGDGSFDITVAEFIAELQPEKQRILEDFVAASEVCDGVKVDNGFVLLVTAEGIDADPDSALPELVEGQC